jgi:hypothetical protein
LCEFVNIAFLENIGEIMNPQQQQQQQQQQNSRGGGSGNCGGGCDGEGGLVCCAIACVCLPASATLYALFPELKSINENGCNIKDLVVLGAKITAIGGLSVVYQAAMSASYTIDCVKTDNAGNIIEDSSGDAVPADCQWAFYFPAILSAASTVKVAEITLTSMWNKCCGNRQNNAGLNNPLLKDTDLGTAENGQAGLPIYTPIIPASFFQQ